MKTLVITSSAFSMLNFRAELLMAMKNKGYEVVAAAPDSASEWAPKLSQIGVKYVSIPLNRTGTNPFEDLRTLVSLIKLIKNSNPIVVLACNAKPVVYGCLAARLAGVRKVYALLAGLGSAFRMGGVKGTVFSRILSVQYKFALSCCNRVFFQNEDDKELFISKKLVERDKAIVINGSGVNLERFRPQPLPQHNVFLFVGRLLRDKGVIEYMEAARHVKQLYPDTRFLVVGPYDTNPTAIKTKDLEPYIKDKIIEYYGATDDVKPFLALCSVFVLPSYHEGTPRSVLEAMATARPIITTDAPGCKQTVIDGENGFLVPIRNVEALVEKIIWMIDNRDKLKKMGEASYKLCKSKYDVNSVNKVILESMGL